MDKIFIVGMPGSGKSTMARYLCSQTNFKYLDLDEEIEKKTGYKESDVIKIMRRSLKPSSFRLWRKRVNQKSIKHRKKFEYSRKQITSKIKKGDYL